MLLELTMTVGGILLILWGMKCIRNGKLEHDILTLHMKKNPILFWFFVTLLHGVTGIGLISAGIFYLSKRI